VRYKGLAITLSIRSCIKIILILFTLKLMFALLVPKLFVAFVCIRQQKPWNQNHRVFHAVAAGGLS
jgi:hypothetical protein